MAEQKSVLSTLFPPGSPQCAPRYTAGQFAVLEFQLTVHEDVFHAFGKLRRLRVCAYILDGRGIEDGDVRKITFFEQSTAQQALALRGKRGHLADALLQRQQVPVPDVMA